MNVNILSGLLTRFCNNKNLEEQETEETRAETPARYRINVTQWYLIPKAYVKATRPSVASMESRYTSRVGTTSLKDLLMFPNYKESITKQSNIIYWFKCGRNECDDEYIGESARNFEERY